MMELSYTLLSDGSSDKALIPILNWLLRNNLNNCAVQAQWADLRSLEKSLRDTFKKRIELSLELYPCELLFIHRDAERDSHQDRVNEIYEAVNQVESSFKIPAVCVVPVRMTEAWLLFDIAALRTAVSNPNGKIALQLPNTSKLEQEPDPKKTLHELLRQASGLSSRRLKRFSVNARTHRVAELIDDFGPLRSLPAFKSLESELGAVIQAQGWDLLQS
ncbi:DUF4276 family protein [Synechococcus sp. PCC 7336]|uniref:DUF4276 family protein n=1 Tax=Synechococcus sp. PCC 7336 TaxID=195250 RepID=UPI0003814F0F|nr:DUF4276 family protein [Synechococcus sp. PCC 7336]